MSWLMTAIGLLLCVTLISCGGYVKKDELEKQLSDQKMDLDQKVQLAQDSASSANDKADRALVATKEMDKVKSDILSTVDTRIEAGLASAKGDAEKTAGETRRIAQEAADKALAAAKAVAMSEDEKVKQEAKEAADKAMNAAMEADRRAQDAAKEAELAKLLPRTTEPTVFDVYFDPGKTVIKPDGVTELEKAADAIKSNPNAVVRVEGHADNSPVVYSKYGNNWVLSQARAQAVRDYLVNKLGVPASSIKETVGFSFYKPTAANDKKDKWANRRTEVQIMP